MVKGIKNLCLLLVIVVSTVIKADLVSEYKLHNIQKDLVLKGFKELQTKESTYEKDEKKREIYNQAKTFMQKTKEEQEKLNIIRQAYVDMPNKIKNQQKAIQNNNDENEEAIQNLYRKKSISQLEEILNRKEDALLIEQKKNTHLSQAIVDEQGLPEANQKHLAQNQKKLLTLYKTLSVLKKEPDTTQDDLKKILLSAEALYIESQNETLSEAMRISNTRLELLTLQRDRVSQELVSLEKSIRILQNMINTRRQAASQAIAESTEKNTESNSQAYLIKKFHQENVVLSQKLVDLSTQISEITKTSQRVNEQINTISSIKYDIKQQAILLDNSLYLARTLRESLRRIPNLSVNTTLAELIAQTRLDHFYYIQQKQEIKYPEKFLKSFDQSESLTEKDKNELEGLVQNRINLLDRLSDSAGKLLTISLALQLDQQSLQSQSKDLKNFLEQKLFWIKSSEPIKINWIIDLPSKIWKELSAIPWLKTIHFFKQAILSHWMLMFLSVCLSLLLYIERKIFIGWQHTITQRIGRVKKDSLLLTPYSLLLSFAYISPIAFLGGSIGLICLLSNENTLNLLGVSTLFSVGTWAMITFLIDVIKPNGIASIHFQWPNEDCLEINQRLRYLRLLLVPLVFLVNLAERQLWQLDQDVLGMILLIIGSLFQTKLIYQLLKSKYFFLKSTFVHKVMNILLIGLSLLQSLLIVIGYYYTALSVEQHIIGTLLLITGCTLLQSIAIRSINIAEHRLSYKRAIEKYKSHDSKSFEEPTLDLATVNQQSLRLLNSAFVVIFALLFYWVWKNLLGVFGIFSTISVWSFMTNDVVTNLYLRDLFFAVVVLVATVILVRNLPGLLEITIFSRLKIPQGNSYAITKLMSYSLSSLGVVITLAYLGLSWNTLQWLVAAVGLGLSIGLREIFANMISGLIILFERPIRIGDTITVGEIKGEVARIRIRATTIEDWEHKEVIIPNSVLLNEKLINWSLSNTVIRIDFVYHVDHNSDRDLIEKLLFQVCNEHPLITNKPAPDVFLAEYGDSALIYELRAFITHVKHRLRARNAINKKVRDLFCQHNIKTAPQKRVLYLNQSSENEKIDQTMT